MSAVVVLIRYLFYFILPVFLRKGVIWLILGCVADVPTLVSLGSL